MSQLNPLAGALQGSFQQQRVLEVDKQRQLRRAQIIEQNIASEDDVLEHEVESSDRVSAVHEDADHPQRQPRKQPRDESGDDKPHIDIHG